MAIIAAPPEHMTRVAGELLASAAALGLAASTVATTSDSPLGIGFLVPDTLHEYWMKHFNASSASPEPEPEDTEPHGTPAPEPKPRGKRGPSKPVTDGPEV